MGVDNKEVQMQHNRQSITLSDFLISKNGGKQFYAKVDNLWIYKLRLTDISSKVTAIITP